MLTDGHDLVGASEPARGGCADLNVILAHGVPHKHGVKGGHLVDPHPGHADDGSDVVHGTDGQPAAVLPLGKVQQRDHSGALVAVRIDGHDGLGALSIFFGELERSVLVIIGRVSMDKDASATAGDGRRVQVATCGLSTDIGR